MRRHSAHVAEHFVSGSGLENIHHFLPKGRDSRYMTAREGGKKPSKTVFACDAAMMLLGILGTVITDNVLTRLLAGVVISGGIVPKPRP